MSKDFSFFPSNTWQESPAILWAIGGLCPPFSSDSLDFKIHILNDLVFKVIVSQDFNLLKCKRKDEPGKLNLNYFRFGSGFVSIPV